MPGRLDGNQLMYAGQIQSGLPLAQAAELRTTLQPVIQPKAAVTHPLRKPKAIWLLPSYRPT